MDAKVPVTDSDAEWQHNLTPDHCDVMRGYRSEAPDSYALLLEKRAGQGL